MSQALAPVIVLNGTSSAGKTTRARALLPALGSGWLHVPLDACIDMQCAQDCAGCDYRMSECLSSGFHSSVAALVATGNGVVVGHVLVEPSWQKEFANLLVRHPVTFVAVEAPLGVLEGREAARDARRKGFERAQWPWVHAGKAYDVRVDTSACAIADAVAAVVALTPSLQSRFL